MVARPRAEGMDGSHAETQHIRGRGGEFSIPEWKLAQRPFSLLRGPIPGKAAQQAVPLLEDMTISRQCPEIGSARLADGHIEISPARAGRSGDKTDILWREVDGCELSDGVHRAHGSIIESNNFLERALPSLAQSQADLDVMDSVASLECPPESSIRRNR